MFSFNHIIIDMGIDGDMIENYPTIHHISVTHGEQA